MTEEADCLSLIVSEETGRISIAQYGEIEYNVTPERVEAALTRRGRQAKRMIEIAKETQA